MYLHPTTASSAQSSVTFAISILALDIYSRQAIVLLFVGNLAKLDARGVACSN